MKAIMYHYVRKDLIELPFLKRLHIDDFRKQLDYFEKKFGFVKKEDFLNALKTGEVPSGVVLTFDDGLKDHHQYVLPELIKRNLWGIFYINNNSYKRRKLLTPHRVHILLGKCGGKKIFEYLTKIVSKDMIVEQYQKKFEKETYKGFTDEDASIETKRILNYYISDQYREAVIDKLIDKFYRNENDLVKEFYLNEQEIKDLSNTGMILGAHTENHPVMSKLSRIEQENEILPCFEYLEKLLKEKGQIRTYCHPYGGELSFNQDTVKILERANCIFSFDVSPRDITKDDLKKKRQALPRYDCNLFRFGQSTTTKSVECN